MAFIGKLRHSNSAFFIREVEVRSWKKTSLSVQMLSSALYARSSPPEKKEYRVIEGVVLRYDFRNDGGDSPTTVEIPIIQDRVTGEIMELDLGSYLIRNACYSIGYLPNTGIAVVVKRI